jgi:hypothetical protein
MLASSAGNDNNKEMDGIVEGHAYTVLSAV